MTIKSEVVLDSVNEHGTRITTMVLEYPRFIHSEFMTHRVFSRNAASSRAVPTDKMIERILENPAKPISWGKNQAGMQASENLEGMDAQNLEYLWTMTLEQVVHNVRAMQEFSPHKQTINRLLEPWVHMQTIVTATEWDNFYSLRCHPDAQPEIKVLAEAMQEAQQNSSPDELFTGEWHIPFVDEENLSIEDQLKVSTARCARTSYFYHDGKKSSAEQDITLHDRLVGSVPLHASPCEHQARAMEKNEFSRNFRGWKQYRCALEGEMEQLQLI